MLSAADAIRQLEALHTAFHVGAVDRLYPNLGESEHAKALKRERQRDSAYLANMRERINGELAALRRDETLTPQERDLRSALVTAREVRYLRQHLSAASWRLQCESDLSRLKAQGEDGAYWLLNPRYEHCETCLRMGERFWPMSVLDRINPAVTHPQCACRLISRAEAERAGHAVVTGRHTATVAQLDLNEAACEMARQFIREGANGHPNGSTPTDIPRDILEGLPPVQEAARPPAEPNASAGQRDIQGDNQKDTRAARDARIAEMWAEQRMSQSAIAREIGLSQPRVRTILLQRFGEEALRARGKPGQRHDLVNA